VAGLRPAAGERRGDAGDGGRELGNTFGRLRPEQLVPYMPGFAADKTLARGLQQRGR
jgi:hypothetical protein